MNKKVQRLVEPNVKMFLFFLVAFSAVTYFFAPKLAMAEAAVTLLLIIYCIVDSRRKRRELIKYIESVTYTAESAKNDTLLNFPLPMAVFRLEDDQIIWGNQVFFQICGKSSPSFGARLTDLVPEFSGKWLRDGRNRCPGLVQVGDRRYQIHGNIVRSAEESAKHEFMGITYWVDVTEYDDIRREYLESKPVVAVIVLDNYDELVKGLPDRAKNDLRGMVEDKISQWIDGKEGFLSRIDRDRYVFIFEERYLRDIIEHKFSLLETAREVSSPSGIHATVSIGVGLNGSSYSENLHFASLGIEMALSRGGDQAVIKNRHNFEFYGGRGSEVETRTKVKSRVMANAFSEFVSDASRVMIMGHKYADLDTLGAAAGVCCIARKCGTGASIIIDEDNNAVGPLLERLKKEKEYADVFISPQEALLQADARTLMVVVDTNRPEQVEDQNLLQACNKVAIIDHHRRAASYIQNAAFTFHEPYASSACELVAELLQELVEQRDILRFEAEAMLTGIVLDTKNFTIRTGERTFESAAFLRRAGADTSEVKRMFQTDFGDTVARYRILQNARLYRQSIAISVLEEPQNRIVAAQAADELLNISKVEASIVLYPTDKGGVIVSARSIGNINVQLLLEKLGGGGNQSAAGAQIENISIRDAVNALFKSIDDYLSE